MHLFCREAKSVTCLVASKFIFFIGRIRICFLVKQHCERGGEQEESDSEWEF